MSDDKKMAVVDEGVEALRYVVKKLEQEQRSTRERLAKYDDVQVDLGVCAERLRVLACWREFHDSVCSCGCVNDAVLRSLEFAEAIIGDDGTEVLAESAETSTQAADPVCGDVVERQAGSDGLFATNVVKLMAKAGTRSQGLRAGWTVEEILYGLRVIMPEVKADEIHEVLMRLVRDGGVENVDGGNPALRIFCLRDDYAERLGMPGVVPESLAPEAGRAEAIRRDIEEILRSNRDASGALVKWKTGGLFYALRDRYPRITRATVAEMASVFEVEPGVYRWVEPRSGVATSGTPSSPPPLGVVEAADAIHGALKSEAAIWQRRIWKESDIVSFLGRHVELGGKLRHEHFSSAEVLTAALDFLVAEGKLEVVPPDPMRPWIKRQGWVLR